MGVGTSNSDLIDQLPHHVMLFILSLLVIAIAVIIFGAWMSTHHDSCRRSVTPLVLGLGAFIFIISIIGFLGALKNNSILLWIYLIMLCIILVQFWFLQYWCKYLGAQD